MHNITCILCINILLVGVSRTLQQGSVFYRQDYDATNNNIVKIDLDCPIERHTYVIISNTTAEQQQSIDQLSTQVSNSKDVEALLDRVNWRMFIYSCEKSNESFLYSSFELQNNCYSSSCSFTDSIDDLFSFNLECGNTTSCASVLDSSLITKWYIFFIFGLISLFGNIVVISDKVISIRKVQNKDKEIQIYLFLVLNLALADSLMGIFLAAISFEI